MAKKILVYHLWPLAWGSIKAMTLFLGRIKSLGCDYVWLSPITQSPRKNHGYDVSDYYAIDERFGTEADFAEFIRTAHAMGLKVIMDLVIDSTSTSHRWFFTDPYRYIWDTVKHDWQNLFDHDSAWTMDDARNKYYLHLGHPAQADLNWFQNGVLNRSLVEYFRNVMSYWLYQRDIDGFRLSNIQSLNKDISTGAEFKFNTILTGTKAVTAVNELANTYGKKVPFLIMDVIDRDGDIVDFYSQETDVEYITSKMLKSSLVKGCSLSKIQKKINHQSKNSKFMLELESHDSPRITSQSGFSGREIIDLMFGSEAHAICLYQGQELGLKNPTPSQLSMVDILNLDARAALQFEKNHSDANSLRQNSRANTRLPLPLDEYARQESDKNSVLNYAKTSISRWKSQ